MAKPRLDPKSVPRLQRSPLSHYCTEPWTKAIVSQILGHLLCQIQIIINLGLQSPELTPSGQTCVQSTENFPVPHPWGQRSKLIDVGP